MIVAASSPQHLQAVRTLWTAYWNELGFTPCFQGFAEELTALPGKYAPPEGRLLLALHDGEPAGAVSFRQRDAESCEAKRLYVSHAFRAHGIGRLLMDRLIEEARKAGYRRMLGDTLPVMQSAISLYDRMGFIRRPRYDGATDAAVYIEYDLA